MGLGSALVDQARTVRLDDTGERVAGSTVLAMVEGNWFRARLELPAGPEQPGPNESRRRAITQPTLLYEEWDEIGEPVLVHNETRVQVQSEQYGVMTFVVIDEPQPVRKKRRVIAHQATMRHIHDHEFDPLGPA